MSHYDMLCSSRVIEVIRQLFLYLTPYVSYTTQMRKLDYLLQFYVMAKTISWEFQVDYFGDLYASSNAQRNG